MNIVEKYTDVLKQQNINGNVTSNRDYSGVYVNGDVLIGKEHLSIIDNNLEKNNAEICNNRVSFLHFFKKNNLLVCFIDNIAFFSQDSVDNIVNAVVRKCSDIGEIYLYRSLGNVKRIYYRH